MSDWGRRDSPGERFEIELSAVDARTLRASAAKASSRPGEPPDSGQGPGEPPDDVAGNVGDAVPRRTLLITALGVGIAALAIGWIVGRGGSGDDVSATATTTPSTVQVTTTERVADTIAPPPMTVRPRPSTTTTTTIPAGTPVDILLDPYLTDLPYELALSTYNGELLRISLAQAVMRRYEISSSTGEPFNVAFSPTEDLLAFSPWGSNSVRQIDLDGTSTELVRSTLDRMMVQVTVDGAGEVWVISPDDTATNLLSPADSSGTIDLPNGNFYRNAAAGDPAGGLLTYGAGDTFSINRAGITRITSGELVAIGPDRAVALECAEDFTCDYVVIDRTTGARDVFPMDDVVNRAAPVGDSLSPTTESVTIVQPAGLWQQPLGSLAAATAVVPILNTTADEVYSSGLAVLNIDEQRVVGVITDAYGPAAISPDGAWVFTIDNRGRLIAFEVATSTTYEFGPPTGGIHSITLRTT